MKANETQAAQLSDRVRILRYRARFTPAQLAERAEIAPKRLASLETPRGTADMYLDEMERITKACGLAPACFFEIVPTPEERAALRLSPRVWPVGRNVPNETIDDR